MFRQLRIGCCMLAFLLASVPFAATQPGKSPAGARDRADLQGKWVVLSYEVDGKMDPGALGLMLTVSGNRLTIGKSNGPPFVDVAIQSINADNNPKTLDVAVMGQKDYSCCIYKLEEDDLSICFGAPGNSKDRPADFSGKKHGVYVLRRFVDPAAVVRAGDTQRLQGKWEVVSIQENGKTVPPKEIGKMSLIFFGSRIKILIGDKVANDTFFTLDEGKNPRAIDIIDKWDRDDRERHDHAILGIYDLNIDKVKGDTLKLCLSRQSSYKEKPKSKELDAEDREKTRPTKFISTKDVGLIALKRVRMERGDLFGYRQSKRFVDPQQDWLTLRQIAQAMLHYEAEHKKFPSAAICDAGGTPLLSWRVALLPFIEQKALYEQFKLNEPWDSEHNQKLIAKMPDMYDISAAMARVGETNYRVIVGDGAGFDMVKGMKTSDIKDGLANTLLVVQAAEPVIWTKPDELVYGAKKPLPDFGDFYGDGRFQASFYDGTVKELHSKLTPENTLRALITRSGAEKGPFDFGPGAK